MNESHKEKTLDKNKKIQKKRLLARTKTFDYKNIVNLDENISEMDVSIKTIPSIKNKNLFIQNPMKIKAFNNTIKLKKIRTFNIPSFKHCNSISSTTSSFGEKVVKKVTFSTVEIIRVEKYKKYNAISNFSKNQIMKNMEEIKKNENENICFIF